MSEKITDEDIKFWEDHLNLQLKHKGSLGAASFCKHLLKLAKTVKYIQDNVIGWKAEL